MTEARIVVAYELVETSSSTLASPSPELAAAEYVIITTGELAVAAQKLADFYSARGLPTAVVDVDWIYATYPEAEPIYWYPGIYTMPPPPGVLVYNSSLALKIISFLRDTAAHPFLTHVLLLGTSDKVPPSFYYYNWLGIFYPWDFWVPTDIFYASPDYDLVLDYAVGRIPAHFVWEAAAIVDKIIGWHIAAEADPAWMRKASLAGGYPFGLLFPYGESLISDEVLREGLVRQLNVTFLTRTDFTYNRSSVLDRLSGGLGWLYVICHGDGTSWVDLLYNETLDIMTLEHLANTFDLMALSPNPAVPIVVSPACMNAAWDDETIPPIPIFMPPSFGEAILSSPAGGIAYIGSSRIAWATIFYNFTKGVMDVDDLLACRYLHEILKAYREISAVEPSTTLGEVVKEGATSYAEYLGAYPKEIYPFAELTLMQFVLLGDPALSLPTYPEPYVPGRVLEVEVTNPLAQVPIKSITPVLAYWRAAEGEVPYVPTAYRAIELRVVAEESEVVTVRIARVFGWYWLPFRELLAGHIIPDVPLVRLPVVNETAVGAANLTFLTSGHLLLKISAGQDEWRVFVLGYGIETMEPEATSGSQVTLQGAGLDVLGPPGMYVDLEFAGTYLAKARLTKYGFERKNVLIPWAEPGVYNFTAVSPPIVIWGLPAPPLLPEAYAPQRVLLSEALALIKAATGDIAEALRLLNATIVDISGDVVTLVTDLGLIKVDVSDIKPRIHRMEGDTAYIKTTVGDISGRVVEIEGRTATIETDVGTILVELPEEIREVKEALLPPTTAAAALSAIAVALILLAVFMVRRLRS